MKKSLLTCLLFASVSVLHAQNWTVVAGLNNGIVYFHDDTASGELNMCGFFDTAGVNQVNHISSWNGTSWNALGIPFPNASSVFAIDRYNADLYLSGFFNNWSTNDPFVGRWNGTSFDSIGHFEAGAPIGFTHYQNNLIAYGIFDTVNNTPANCIAKWDGASWSDMGNGDISTIIYHATVFQGELYVAGFAAADTISHVLKYIDATSSWQIVGQAFNPGTVNVLCTYNGKLYVGGYFNKTSNPNNPGNHIAVLNETTGLWENVGGGFDSSGIAQVYDLVVYNNCLYAVGSFNIAGGVPATNIAKWDGTDWCGLGVTTPCYPIGKAAVYNNELYLGIPHIFDGDTLYDYFVKWNGGNYTDTCGHISTAVSEIIPSDGTVSVFPNPVSEIATFQFSGINGTRTIFVFDQLGREIWKEETDENRVEFLAETVEPGIYFYRVEQSGQVRTGGKFIVQ